MDTTRARNRVGMVGALVAIWASCWAGCDKGDAGGKVEQARTAYIQGRLDEAQRLYEEVLDAEPGNAGALVGLANIHLDRESIEPAAELFTRLDALELDRNTEQLVQRARIRYFRQLYDRTRGEGPSAPADPEAYERALVGLFNLEAQQHHIDELVELFARQARAALGAPPGVPLLPNSAFLQDATLAQLRAGRAAYQRLTQRDERLTRVLPIPEDIRSEAEALVLTLEVAIFEREFQERFDERLRPGLIEEGRFDPQAQMFSISFESPEPYSGDVPEGEQLDAMRRQLAQDLVVEVMTDLAYQAKGLERGTNPRLTLGRTPEDREQSYAGIEIVQFDIARNGTVTMELRAPYHLLPRTAYRLEQYLQWRARQPAEGTGAGTGAGTGMGTGGGTGGSASPE